jgi:polysaccharide export outer membrane protein
MRYDFHSMVRVMRRCAVRRGLAVSLVAMLAACSDVPDNMPPAPPVPPPDSGYTENLLPYRIRPGDVLDIRLMLNPELNEEVTVRPDGHISTTVVTDEKAYGDTVPELTATLTRDYEKQLRNPLLSVIVKSVAPIRIYVAGEVVKPGELVANEHYLTLSQAIAEAGGVKFVSGNPDKIFIIRRGPDDVPEFLSTRYQDVMWGHDATADVRLAPYDVVFVPRSGSAEVYQFFYNHFLQFVPVSWGFTYLLNNNSSTTTP